MHTLLEAPVGFEPTIRVLQTHALPLGYGAVESVAPAQAFLTPECTTSLTGLTRLSANLVENTRDN